MMTVFEAIETPIFSIEDLRKLLETELKLLRAKKKMYGREPYEEQIKAVETVKGLIEQAFLERRNKL